MYQKYLFLDRDGTLIKEPESKQIDCLEQLQLLPYVIPALLRLKDSGYRFVMVTNQDGLGTKSYSSSAFELVQTHLLHIFNSQGIEFEAIKICPHLAIDACFCRKPHPGLLLDYISDNKMVKSLSYVIGDRESDMSLAEVLGVQGLLINQNNANDWQNIANFILSQPREAKCDRQTKETNISGFVNLDLDQESNITTGIGFFDHMLEQLAKHAGIYVQLQVEGDLEIDDHHVIEDCGIVLGQLIRQCLGDKFGIARFGFTLPMDEALATIAIDLSGRSYLRFSAKFTRERVGNLATEMIKHFFLSFAQSLQATLHIDCKGENTHHMIEVIFKGVGRTLRQAIQKISATLPTTKGVL